MSAVEKRGHRRIKTQFLNLSFIVESKKCAGLVSDISEQGLCLKTDEILIVGQNIRYSFSLLPGLPKIKDMMGKVMWASAEGKYGIKILSIDESGAETIRKYIEINENINPANG